MATNDKKSTNKAEDATKANPSADPKKSQEANSDPVVKTNSQTDGKDDSKGTDVEVVTNTTKQREDMPDHRSEKIDMPKERKGDKKLKGDSEPIRVKNIGRRTLAMSSGLIQPGGTGVVTQAEYSMLGEFLEKEGEDTSSKDKE